MLVDQPQPQDIQLEISQLEARLHDLRSQLDVTHYPTPPSSYTDTKTQYNMPSGTLPIQPITLNPSKVDPNQIKSNQRTNPHYRLVQ